MEPLYIEVQILQLHFLNFGELLIKKNKSDSNPGVNECLFTSTEAMGLLHLFGGGH